MNSETNFQAFDFRIFKFQNDPNVRFECEVRVRHKDVNEQIPTTGTCKLQQAAAKRRRRSYDDSYDSYSVQESESEIIQLKLVITPQGYYLLI